MAFPMGIHPVEDALPQKFSKLIQTNNIPSAEEKQTLLYALAEPEIALCSMREEIDKSIQRASGAVIVVLNGFPGTGKHTILKRLRELLPADKSSRLIDNHLLIDPVQALFPDRSEDHHDLRRRIRAVFFPCISKLAQEGHVILMTACLAADDDKDAAFFCEHLALVRGTDVPLYWVNAFCDQQALLERAQSPERVQSSKTKLTDPDILRGLVNAHRLLDPGELSDGLTNLVIRSLNTDGEADESARQLMEMVGLPSGAVAG